MKSILMGIGLLSILFFIYLLFVGVKVVSTVLFYVIAVIAIISLIGFGLYFIGKVVGKNSSK